MTQLNGYPAAARSRKIRRLRRINNSITASERTFKRYVFTALAVAMTSGAALALILGPTALITLPVATFLAYLLTNRRERR